MADYKATTVTGTQYQRCNGIYIDNTMNAVKTVRMQEELVSILGGQTIRQPLPGLEFAFNPDEVIALRDPVTGELTGSTITGMEVYAVLYSLYYQKAQERDAAGAV